jgi:hypothetical protein
MAKSRPTFTFLVLVAVAAAATYGALLLTSQMSEVNTEVALLEPVPQKVINNTNQQTPAQAVNLDTSTWKNYVDRTYFLSFKYPPTWEVETFPDRAGYYIIVLKPDTASDHVRIYVSPSTYFALTGLPAKKDTLAGAAALNVNDMLVGVKYAAQYYTFDMGMDTRVQPQFQKILTTVAFSR